MVEHTQRREILGVAEGDSEVADSEERMSSNWKNLESFVRDEITLVLPPNISGAFEHEPLASFLGSLTPREHYMFQHCELHLFQYHYVSSVIGQLQRAQVS